MDDALTVREYQNLHGEVRGLRGELREHTVSDDERHEKTSQALTDLAVGQATLKAEFGAEVRSNVNSAAWKLALFIAAIQVAATVFAAVAGRR